MPHEVITCLEVIHPVLIAAQGGVITKGEVGEVADPEVWPVDLLEDLQRTEMRLQPLHTSVHHACIRSSLIQAGTLEASCQDHKQHHTMQVKEVSAG